MFPIKYTDTRLVSNIPTMDVNNVFKMVLSMVAKLLRMNIALICALRTVDEICRLIVKFESIIIPRAPISFDHLSK